MLALAHDLRFALRLWRQRPGFTAVALLSLALGIGANTSIFSVMDALLLRQLPVKQPERLVLFGAGQMSGMSGGLPDGSAQLFSPPFLDSVRQKNDVFAGVSAVESMSEDLHARFAGSNAELEPLKIRVVSGNYFAMLGVGAAVGRVLTGDDDQKPGANPVAVMSYRFWQRRFARDSRAIGQAVTLHDTAFTIVGVAAREFSGTAVDESPDLWVPLSMQAQVQPWIDHPRDPLTQSLLLMGRLKDGITMVQAQANVNVLFKQWIRAVAGASPSADQLADMKKARIELHEAATGTSELRVAYEQPLRILMVLVGVVLLIACVNIANLLLAQATGRQREIAVRLALGANRRRLMSQLLAESVLLALVGGALGILLAWWGGQLLLTLVQKGTDPLPISIGPNASVLLFALALSLITGMVFGLAPALQTSRAELATSLREGKGTARVLSRSRLGQMSVAAQVALALFLMIGAGLFVRTFERLEQSGIGLDASRVVLLHLDATATSTKDLDRMVEERLRALPGVQAVSFSMLNFNEGIWYSRLWPEGVPHTESTGMSADGNRVGHEYFRALGLPIVLGRDFGPQDTPGSGKVVVVNETLARKLYPGTSPVGSHLQREGKTLADLEIIGVVKDAKFRSLRQKSWPMFFLDSEQTPEEGFNDVVLRTAGPRGPLMPEIRAAIRSLDPSLAVWDVTPLEQWVDRSLGREKLLAKLAGFFGALALLLASIGLYGVMAYSVARRTNEIGIRMALGAQPAGVLRMVLRESLILVGLGVIVGIPAALACGRFVASQLYGVSPNDPITIAGAAAVLVTVALIASFLPARRAAMLDPLTALREE